MFASPACHCFAIHHTCAATINDPKYYQYWVLPWSTRCNKFFAAFEPHLGSTPSIGHENMGVIYEIRYNNKYFCILGFHNFLQAFAAKLFFCLHFFCAPTMSQGNASTMALIFFKRHYTNWNKMHKFHLMPLYH